MYLQNSPFLAWFMIKLSSWRTVETSQLERFVTKTIFSFFSIPWITLCELKWFRLKGPTTSYAFRDSFFFQYRFILNIYPKQHVNIFSLACFGFYKQLTGDFDFDSLTLWQLSKSQFHDFSKAALVVGLVGLRIWIDKLTKLLCPTYMVNLVLPTIFKFSLSFFFGRQFYISVLHFLTLFKQKPHKMVKRIQIF